MGFAKILLIFGFLIKSSIGNCPPYKPPCKCKEPPLVFNCSNGNDENIYVNIHDRGRVTLNCVISSTKNVYKLIPNDIETYLGDKYVVELLKHCEFQKALDFMSKFPKANAIQINEKGMTNLESNFFDDVTGIEDLDLSNNRLQSIDSHVLKNLTKLRNLDLSMNEISILHNYSFNTNLKLEHFRMSGNLKELELQERVFANMKQLLSVTLDSSRIRSIPENFFHNSTLSSFAFSHNLLADFRGFSGLLTRTDACYLFGNQIKEIHWNDNMRFSKSINYTNNNITLLRILPTILFPDGCKSTIDFRYGKVEYIKIVYDVPNLADNLTLKFDGVSFQCDLALYSLLETAETKKMNVQFGESKCLKPTKMKNKLLKTLKSSELKCNSENYFLNCTCVYGEDQFLQVDCSSSELGNPPDFRKNAIVMEDILNVTKLSFNFSQNFLSNLPDISDMFDFKVVSIDARNNSIIFLYSSHLTDDVEYLDLRNNGLKYLTVEIVEMLSKIERLWLGNNPWVCDCSTLDFFKSLKSLRNILDSKDVFCVNNNKNLFDLYEFEVCFNWPLFSGITSFLAISGIIIGLFYKFKKDLKMFCFAHNLCLWFVSEEDLDEDKEYDAFVCFADLDQPIVEDIILDLENDERRYLCLVGVRDWPLGRMIPELISESIRQSRRVILFLSKNFINSDWCRYEFRAALIEACYERRNRIIVIITNDVIETDSLDDELKSYLRLHLYIKFEDPKFWQKLEYAMPHRTGKKRMSRIPGRTMRLSSDT